MRADGRAAASLSGGGEERKRRAARGCRGERRTRAGQCEPTRGCSSAEGADAEGGMERKRRWGAGRAVPAQGGEQRERRHEAVAGGAVLQLRWWRARHARGRSGAAVDGWARCPPRRDTHKGGNREACPPVWGGRPPHETEGGACGAVGLCKGLWDRALRWSNLARVMAKLGGCYSHPQWGCSAAAANGSGQGIAGVGGSAAAAQVRGRSHSGAPPRKCEPWSRHSRPK